MALLDEEKKAINNNNEAVTDIDLSVTAKKRFRINGDNNRILELNVSDMSVITRLRDIEPKLEKLALSVQDFEAIGDEDENSIGKMADKFEEVDNEMRKLMDDIFQSNVSEVCAPKSEGSMYDPFNGKFRFEWVLEALIDLHASNIQEQFKRMSTQVNKHTAKYTKKRKK